MKRKLIQLSPTTLVVSLPKEWTTQQRLKKGAYLDVVPQGNTLLVKVGEQSQQQHKAAKITMSGSKNRDAHNLIDWYKVTAAYVAGCSKIELTFPDKTSAAAADKFPSKFPGMIAEQTSEKRVLLRDIGADVVDIDKIAQKVFHLLVSLSQEIPDAAVRKKKDYLINSYVALGLRQLRMQSYDILTWSGLFYNLEQLGDLLVTSKTKDESQIKDLQILYLSFAQEQLLKIITAAKSDNPLHQQILACAQSIQQVRSDFTSE